MDSLFFRTIYKSKNVELVFATNNPHKLEELRTIVGAKCRILSLADIGCHDDIPETADTIEGNALRKALWVKEKYGYDCFADDTGLMVEALGGAPGVYTARFAGDHCSPDDNIDLLLAKLDGLPAEKRKAFFATAIALVTDCEQTTFVGRVDGTIATSRSGNGGFGYDPIFIPDETGISFACMAPEEKNRISHRGRATQKLLSHLGLTE